MPVKRRISKRHDAQAYEIWGSIFSSGFDFFDELPDLGLETDAYDRPKHDDALAAWERYGAIWLEHNPESSKSWAETKFGRPWENADAS